jgi:hypothetical protein
MMRRPRRLLFEYPLDDIDGFPVGIAACQRILHILFRQKKHYSIPCVRFEHGSLDVRVARSAAPVAPFARNACGELPSRISEWNSGQINKLPGFFDSEGFANEGAAK